MKKLLLLLLALLPATIVLAGNPPQHITFGGQTNHVQGIAWDEAREVLYMSFTTRFIIVDRDGNLKGSVDKIHGHLGAMTWDPIGRKVYASLEQKADEIGASISQTLGVKTYSKTQFFVVEIDVDAIKEVGTPMERVMKRHEIYPAEEDFLAQVSINGQTFDHRYGCSGIDGVAIAPGFAGDKHSYLYVAYGIYGDVERTDNDHQVILRYRIDKLDRKPERFFVPTGNTTYGVQNMAYDPHSGLLFLAVYPGRKAEHPNYDLFAVDMNIKPRKVPLSQVPYHTRKANILTLTTPEGWHFPYGSTGLCPLNGGKWYFARPSEVKSGEGKGHACDATLYQWNGAKSATPFTPIEN